MDFEKASKLANWSTSREPRASSLAGRARDASKRGQDRCRRTYLAQIPHYRNFHPDGRSHADARPHWPHRPDEF
jgi:hypothetical protein